MTEPLVSVALATYNGAPYLAEQLETIYAQDWSSLEVVASDDASSDETPAILQRFARERGLILHRQSVRVGLVANFESSLRLATGPYVALADQDDVWKPHRIRRLMSVIGGGALAYSPSRDVLFPDGRVEVTSDNAAIETWAKQTSGSRPVEALVADNWIVSHQMLLARRVIERALPFPADLIYHDGWLAACAAMEGAVVFLDESLQIYRRHPGSVTFPRPSDGSQGVWSTRLRRDTWRERARREMLRLDGIRTHGGTTPALVPTVEAVLKYYRAGVVRGWRFRSFAGAFKTASWFWNAQRPLDRWRFILRPLLLGREYLEDPETRALRPP